MNASHSSFEYFLLSGVVWKVEGNNHASEGGEGGESGISNLRRFFLGVFSDFLQEHSIYVMNDKTQNPWQKSKKVKKHTCYTAHHLIHVTRTPKNHYQCTSMHKNNKSHCPFDYQNSEKLSNHLTFVFFTRTQHNYSQFKQLLTFGDDSYVTHFNYKNTLLY